MFSTVHTRGGVGWGGRIDRPFLSFVDRSLSQTHTHIHTRTRARSRLTELLKKQSTFSRLYTLESTGISCDPERISVRSLSLSVDRCRREKPLPRFLYRHARVSTNNRGNAKRALYIAMNRATTPPTTILLLHDFERIRENPPNFVPRNDEQRQRRRRRATSRKLDFCRLLAPTVLCFVLEEGWGWGKSVEDETYVGQSACP